MADPVQTLDYVTPDGERVALTPDQVPTFERLGYRPEGVESKVAAAYEAQTGELYGGAAETARTFGERALSGVTLGGSDLLFRGVMGVDAEDLAGRSEANPLASGLGTVTGIVGGSLAGSALAAGRTLGSGATALGFTPAGLTTRLGESIAARGAGRSALASTGYSALGTGIEGALFSSGQYLSDVVLENKPLAAEAFLASMGEGALFGAGLGGGLSLLGHASRAGSDKIAGLLTRKSENLLKKTEDGVSDTTLQKLTPKHEATPKKIERAEAKAETAIADQHVKVDTLLAEADALLAKAMEARSHSMGTLLDDQLDGLLQRADEAVATSGNARYAELEARVAKLKSARQRVDEWQSSLKTHDPVTGEVAGPGLLAQPRNRKGQAYGTSDEGVLRFLDKRSIQQDIRAERAAMGAGKKVDDLSHFREGFDALADYERTSFKTAEEFLRLMDEAPELATAQAGRISEDFAPYLDAVARNVGEGAAQGPGASALFSKFPTAKQAEKIAKDEARAGERAAKAAERESARAFKSEAAAARKGEREAARSARETEKGIKIGGLDAADFLALNEVVGFAGADLRDVPVIGPVLSAWLVASRLKGRLGGASKLVSKARGGAMVEVAEKAASARNKLADAAKTFVKGGRAAVKGMAPTALPVATALKTPLYDSGTKPAGLPKILADKSASIQRDFEARAREITEVRSNPEAMRQRLALQVPLGDPALLRELGDAVMRKFEALYEAMPVSTPPESIYGEDVSYSQVELEQFGEVCQAVDKPVEWFAKVLAGEPLPHVVKALKTSAPALYAEAQELVLEEVAEDPAAVPYEDRITLGFLFEVATDATMRPEYLNRVQVAGGEAAQAEAAQPVASITAPTRFGLAEQTSAQRVAGGLG